tara:strand:+ start:96 stop:491 length:396 start_codon:yes stop_codon:yes gene_type:complete
MLNGKKVVENKSLLFAAEEATCHFVKVAPNVEEYLKVWVKEPTWLQVEQAMNAIMKIDSKSGGMDIDLKAMYNYAIDNFIEKTEPSLSKVDLIRLSPFVGNQLKEILPNPLQTMTGDEAKNEESEMPSVGE